MDWCQFGCLAHQHDPDGKFAGHGWAHETWTFAAYDPVSRRVVNDEAFAKACCSEAARGKDSVFANDRCTCAANIREHSERADGVEAGAVERPHFRADASSNVKGAGLGVAVLEAHVQTRALWRLAWAGFTPALV